MNISVLGSTGFLGSRICNSLRSKHFVREFCRKDCDFSSNSWLDVVSKTESSIFIVNFFDHVRPNAQQSVVEDLWSKYKNSGKTILILGSSAAYHTGPSDYFKAKKSINQWYRKVSTSYTEQTTSRLILLEPAMIENNKKYGLPYLFWYQVIDVIEFVLTQNMQFMQLQFRK